MVATGKRASRARPQARRKPPGRRNARGNGRATELADARAQLAATAEILGIMANSPSNVQPVLEAVARNAANLCAATDAVIHLKDGDLLRFSAHFGEIATTQSLGDARPIGRDWVVGRATLERRQFHIHDMRLETVEFPLSVEMTRHSGYRTILTTPLMRDGVALGAISIRRTEVRPFTEKQIALVNTFANQAVIAIENVRLFNETKEALERQTATAEILKVISSSPSDLKPVFDSILSNATKLCDAHLGILNLYDGEKFRTGAQFGGNPEFAKWLPERGAFLPSPGSTLARALAERQPVQTADVRETQAYRDGVPVSVKMADLGGARTYLAVPLMKEGEVLGSIGIYRPEVRPFTERQIALVRTFADQAVIAIENVRLFNETKEALERQTATAEILKVIAGSPSDVQPVFDAIAKNALRLIGGLGASVTRVVGDTVHLLAHTATDQAGIDAMKSYYPRPLSLMKTTQRVLRSGEPEFRSDIENNPEAHPETKELARTRSIQSTLWVPLLRDGVAFGTINVSRTETGPFSDHQIDLLKTFADQAVIAIENVRLFNETKEALERQTATAEILKVIASSPSDVQPVFDAIAHSALRLIGGLTGAVTRISDDALHLAAYTTTSESGDDVLKNMFPTLVARASGVSGRIIQDRVPAYIADTESDPMISTEYRAMARARGFRSVLGVPMIREGSLVGVISVTRRDPGMFTRHQIELLKTFADQAVIAIENVRLFNETRESLERQTATAEILKVIASSLSDVQPAFEAIVQSAARLFAPWDSGISMREGELIQLRAMAGSRATPELNEQIRKLFPVKYDPRESVLGRVIAERRVVEIRDTEDAGRFEKVKAAGRAGQFRSTIYVPLVRNDEGIGAITLTHPEPGANLNAHQLALLKTFADQAVIAIENVRLFNETKEALERQTATAEILRAISSSPSDIKPVFDAIGASAIRLLGGFSCAVSRIEGEKLHLSSFSAVRDTGDELLKNSFPFRISRNPAVADAVRRRAAVYVADTENDSRVGEPMREVARARGYRSMLHAPMLREGEVIGLIHVTRAEAGAFTDHDVQLIKTFADQAVIAIENVRLFKELQQRTEALTKSVGQLTALGEVGQAISSTLELETVLKTIVSRAVQLTGLDGGAIYEYDEATEVFRMQIAENIDPELMRAVRDAPVRKGDGAIGGTAISHEAIQVPDTLDDGYHSGRKELLIRAGYRAILAVPLLREDHLLGALLVTRKTPGLFAPEIVELLKTFGTQSAMAIQNARLFREIADKGKQLEVASRHKSDFLASMSHELRTPLNAILGLNEMVLGQVYGEVPADMQPPLAQVQTSGKHLLRLINNVLDLAKIEAGRMELALADYSVQDAVQSVRSTLHPLAADKGLEFVASAADDIPLAYGDGGRIAQCLMNLAGNALKFTKQGKVEISVVEKGGLLTYRVCDTGIGIPPGKIGGLFTEFKQTDATVASEYGGTGLGLSISKKFVEMHGGRIWVESEPGKGSAFIFEIPLRVDS